MQVYNLPKTSNKTCNSIYWGKKLTEILRLYKDINLFSIAFDLVYIFFLSLSLIKYFLNHLKPITGKFFLFKQADEWKVGKKQTTTAEGKCTQRIIAYE